MQFMMEGQNSAIRLRNDSEQMICIYPLNKDELSFPNQFDYQYLIGTSRNVAVEHNGQESILDPTMLIPINLAKSLNFKSYKHIYVMRVQLNWLEELLPKFPVEAIFNQDLGYIYRLQGNQFVELVSRFIKLQQIGHGGKHQAFNSLMIRTFFESMEEQYTRYRSQYTRSNHLKMVNQMVHKIQLGVNDKLSIDELIKPLSASKYHLSRLFTEVTGQSMIHYHRQVRLHHIVSELLENQCKPVEVLADEYNFASSSHMTSAFKNYFGIVPRELRRMAKCK